MLRAEDLDVTLGGCRILDGVSLALAPGELLAVVGPNGAGKSTLLKALSGALTPTRGTVSLDGQPLRGWPREKLARRRAVLPQHSQLTFPFLVLEVVMLGRSPHAGRVDRGDDVQIAASALHETDATALAHRLYTTLSGGEQQRVHLARVLAQIWPNERSDNDEARYLLLDEPTSSLDLSHQHAVLETARRFTGQGIGVLAVLHDLNLAAMYGDRLCMMYDGRLVAEGPPAQVLKPETIHDVFGVGVHVQKHPVRDCLHIIPN